MSLSRYRVYPVNVLCKDLLCLRLGHASMVEVRESSLAWLHLFPPHHALPADGVTVWKLAGDAGVSEGVPGDTGGWSLRFLRLQRPGDPLPVSSKSFWLFI